MRFGGKKSNVVTAYYKINGNILEFVAVRRGLRIRDDSRLRFHEHIREVVRKAGHFGGELLHLSVYRSSEFVVPVFITHLRSIMDFCSGVWSVGYLGDVRLLESVQRRWMDERDYWHWTSQLC